jgi:hypothetical protein
VAVSKAEIGDAQFAAGTIGLARARRTRAWMRAATSRMAKGFTR